ncbi:MAG: 3-hydroxyacyl-CoA dehydrogenase NAD-binding domain-containing protein [Nitrososphaerales archaeon]
MINRKVSCIGAGTIGHSWATLFSWHGLEVNLYDEDEEALDKAFNLIKSNLKILWRYIESPLRKGKKL